LEFKFQKWFDQILCSIEIPTNFRMFELFEFDSNEYKGKKQRALFPFGPPLAVPKPARLVAHLKSRVLAGTHGTQCGAGDCPVAPATPVTRTSGEAD
jgi:hypothetical protein